MAVSANRLELLQIADAVAREALIDKDIVIAAMEDAMAKAARSRYGTSSEIRAELDTKTGETRLHRVLLVVDKVENDATEISVEAAQKRNPAAQAGDTILDPLPPFDFGGIVKRVEYGNVIVDLGRAEAIVRRDEGLPREAFRPNDRIRAYLYDVRRETRGPQLFLSRTHPQFMAKLFAQEVPEIYDGIIEIKAVARDPGSRAKIAVISKDSSIDPVGACVGMRGSRVQAVVQELQGEKIDIIPWSPDAATFIVNALQPAEVSKVVLDEDAGRIDVVVPEEQLSLAIGRRGQNVRLASQLTGWDIKIMTEAEESERRQKEFQARTETFMTALDVDETLAQLLAAEGFANLEELAYVEPHELSSIDGIDEETGAELQRRALDVIEAANREADAKRRELGVLDEVGEIPGMTPQMMEAFGENDVKTVEDVAGCSADDLTGYDDSKKGERFHVKGILEDLGISKDDAEALVMQARVMAGWVEAEPEVSEVAEAGAEA